MNQALKRSLTLISILAAAACLSGCAEIDPFETSEEVMRNPLGRENTRLGMSKDEVRSKWGDPDIVNVLPAKDVSAIQGEEWVYKARRYTPVPLDSGYLDKTKYLYFDGNNLTAMGDEPKSTKQQ